MKCDLGLQRAGDLADGAGPGLRFEIDRLGFASRAIYLLLHGRFRRENRRAFLALRHVDRRISFPCESTGG